MLTLLIVCDGDGDTLRIKSFGSDKIVVENYRTRTGQRNPVVINVDKAIAIRNCLDQFIRTNETNYNGNTNAEETIVKSSSP